ncbi:17933_t:CDS:2 [Cetraspora pellucida]|uniref:17933_t:CDS:1 n=1 Tax=Cetraspora pellucida TaxID=1433469 RepID=A0ACA9KF68_9GLOM|nr:17933_t:CDS:2 [Cetraspora pellucida]
MSNTTPDSSLKLCTGTLRFTMGIPCRRLEFLEPAYPMNNDTTDLQPLLQSLAQIYQFWSPHQQTIAYSTYEHSTEGAIFDEYNNNLEYK